MAFSFGSTGNRRRAKPLSRSVGTLSEINIIPLVDVVLVLLIIFMLTAHVMEFGLEVEVPKVNQVRNTAEELPVVTITEEWRNLPRGKARKHQPARRYDQQRYPSKKGVYLRADKGTVWDPIAQVISKLGESKLDVRVVTQPEDEAEPAQVVEMTRGIEILDERDSIRTPLLGSVVLRGSDCARVYVHFDAWQQRGTLGRSQFSRRRSCRDYAGGANPHPVAAGSNQSRRE